MRELPKIARDRLATAPLSAPHLDANLISAFAEHSLLPDERQRVIAHMSTCGQCRAEVQLMIGAAQGDARGLAAARAEAQPSRQGFSWQRLLRWQPVTAALTVAAITVSVLVSTRYRVSHVSRPAAPAQDTLLSKAAPPPSPATAAGNATVRLQAPGPRSEAKQPAGPPIPGPNEAARAVKRTLAEQRERKAVANAVSAQLVSGTATAVEQTEVRQLAVAAPAPPPTQAASVPAPAPPAAAPQSTAEGVTVPAGAAPARGVEPAPAAMPLRAFAANSAIAPRRKMRALEPAVRWMVPADAAVAQVNQGAVERSVDGGRTWQRVPVADGVTFRVVFALGNDVWAGGTAGAFYHSSDGGQHWSSISLAATATAGGTAVGDIVSIQFADARHGVLSTSTGATWTTSDGGQTWQQAPQN